MALLLLALGCAPADRCDAMCDAALARFSACMEERGLTWGASVGYADAEDYANWCDTWAWEQRQLGEEAVCEEREATFRDGDCDAYYAAWAP